jgi:hypothetical protein
MSKEEVEKPPPPKKTEACSGSRSSRIGMEMKTCNERWMSGDGIFKSKHNLLNTAF